MADAPLLTAEGLGRAYRRRRSWALRDVDLAIPQSSITALVGPNGAGKSSLIRCWMGFERPDAGRAFVNGHDVRRNRATVVRQIGYVPQAVSLYRELTVEDHFRFATVHRPKFDRAYARERVHAVDIEPNRRVGQLSGGEQAQVALALALGTRAPILLLDEPLASLDPLARREFLTVLVEEVRGSRATAVLASHIVTDVEQACDSLIVLSGGQVAIQTSIADACARHRALPERDLDGRRAVATFRGPEGERLALVTGTESTLREATLEEIVLGYLAARAVRVEDTAA